MAGVHYTLTPDGLETIQKRLNQLKQRGDNLQPLFADIGELLLLSHDERFRQQVSPDGEPWQPLSEHYRKRKPRHQDTILKLNDHLGRELNYIATGSDLFFGTPYEYGAIHQFGGTPEMPAGPAAIPARPWLGVSQEDVDAIHQMVADFLSDT
ncbi:phage virion morphogenesis protein [Vibrio quintilis]|uniref:Phage virion morphogenesis family protein n=1 Tax=Vibrio quintilis TaxID=1117707 RepID=A0A1M7Z1F8_9VIBR|nr:phage virion morphogenesis protein [Vibrio quintilis]SHO58788.1 Phage virion morphogenesis family protein [Vibrio quintilis]